MVHHFVQSVAHQRLPQRAPYAPSPSLACCVNVHSLSIHVPYVSCMHSVLPSLVCNVSGTLRHAHTPHFVLGSHLTCTCSGGYHCIICDPRLAPDMVLAPNPSI